MASRRWIIWISVFIVVVSLAGSIYAALAPTNSMMNWYNIDDAFYYYKVAENFVAGHGFSFDGINPTNGFHPLWMVICISIFWMAKYSLIFPLRVLIVVAGFFNAASALLLFHFLRKFIHRYAALLGALCWALLPQIYNVSTLEGMESTVSSFFMILLLSQAALFVKQNEGKINFKGALLLGLWGALTILSRLDNVFIVAMVGLFVIFRIKKIPAVLIYDWAALGFAVVASWVSRLGFDTVSLNIYPFYPMVGVAILINPLVYYCFGMYAGFNQKSMISKLLRQVGAAVVNLGAMYALSAILYHLGVIKIFSRSVIMLDAAITFLLILCLRLVQQKEFSEPAQRLFLHFGLRLRNAVSEGIGYAIPIGFIVGAYCALNKIFYGTFSPISGQVKVWWGTMSNTAYNRPSNLIQIFGLSPNGGSGPWSIVTSKLNAISVWLVNLIKADDVVTDFVFLLFVVLFLLLLGAIFKAQDGHIGRAFASLLAPAFLIGAVIQIGYYGSVSYGNVRGWYWLAEMLTCVLIFAVVSEGAILWLEKRSSKFNWALPPTILVVLCLVFLNGRFVLGMVPPTVKPGMEQHYIQETLDLESYTPKGAIIGMTGGGMVAYFIEDRTIVNLDGLINSPAYFHAMKTGTATQFLDKIPLEYVYGNEYIVLESDPYVDFLPQRLQKIGVIRSENNFTLYRYVINQ